MCAQAHKNTQAAKLTMDIKKTGFRSRIENTQQTMEKQKKSLLNNEKHTAASINWSSSEFLS